MTYRLLVDYQVFEFLESIPKSDQRLLRDRMRAIQNFPSQHSDYQEPDEQARPLDISICGPYAIRFWEDVIDMHIKILEISWADK